MGEISGTRRALGSWLAGPPRSSSGYAGAGLGLPESGRGSLASFGEKLLAVTVDLVIAGVVGLILIRPNSLSGERVSNAVGVGVFVVLTAFGLMTSGRTVGMRVMALQVVRRDGQRIGSRAVLRQALVAIIVPALIVNAERRGLHDRRCNTMVVRVR